MTIQESATEVPQNQKGYPASSLFEVVLRAAHVAAGRPAGQRRKSRRPSTPQCLREAATGRRWPCICSGAACRGSYHTGARFGCFEKSCRESHMNPRGFGAYRQSYLCTVPRRKEKKQLKLHHLLEMKMPKSKMPTCCLGAGLNRPPTVPDTEFGAVT